MTECVQEYDVVLHQDEIAMVELLYRLIIQNYARDHFINNEGWTQKEVDTNLKIDDPEIEILLCKLEDGSLTHKVTNISVPVTVIRSKTDDQSSG